MRFKVLTLVGTALTGFALLLANLATAFAPSDDQDEV